MTKIIVEWAIGPWSWPGKDPTTQQTIIERPMQADGSVCFDGRWVWPKQREDGRYYLEATLPTPTTPLQAAINSKCITQLLEMAVREDR